MLGAGGEGRIENPMDIPFAFGSINTVSYGNTRGIDRVEGAFLDAQGTTCPIQFSFLGDPWMDLWGLMSKGCGAVSLCGAAQTNTLNLDLSFANAPSSQVVWVLEKISRRRGGRLDNSVTCTAETPIPRGVWHLGICRSSGSTNPRLEYERNGQETDLLQLGACGSGTVVEHIELLASADDGLHIFGGMVEVRRVMSAFHAEDALKVTGDGRVWAALVWPSRHSLAHASNPPGRSFVYDAEDDFEESNMDLRQNRIARRP